MSGIWLAPWHPAHMMSRCLASPPVTTNPRRDPVPEGVRLVRVRTAASRLPVLYSDPTRPHALPLPDPVVGRAIRDQLATGPIRCGARP